MRKRIEGQLSLLDLIPIEPAGHGKDPSRVQLPLVPEAVAQAIASGEMPQIEQESPRAPSLETESSRFKVGQRVRVKGLAEAGPVYYDDGGHYVWVCFGYRATPHDRADVTPEVATEPLPIPAGVSLWHEAGLACYQRLRDRFAFLLQSEPHTPPAKTAMRQHMVAHLQQLLDELQEKRL